MAPVGTGLLFCVDAVCTLVQYSRSQVHIRAVATVQAIPGGARSRILAVVVNPRGSYMTDCRAGFFLRVDAVRTLVEHSRSQVNIRVVAAIGAISRGTGTRVLAVVIHSRFCYMTAACARLCLGELPVEAVVQHSRLEIHVRVVAAIVTIARGAGRPIFAVVVDACSSHVAPAGTGLLFCVDAVCTLVQYSRSQVHIRVVPAVQAIPGGARSRVATVANTFAEIDVVGSAIVFNPVDVNRQNICLPEVANHSVCPKPISATEDILWLIRRFFTCQRYQKEQCDSISHVAHVFPVLCFLLAVLCCQISFVFRICVVMALLYPRHIFNCSSRFVRVVPQRTLQSRRCCM